MALPNDKDWHWHECLRCKSLFAGELLRRNQVIGSERPVLILSRPGTDEFFFLLVADLNQLPFEADDRASGCGGMLPMPWGWEDLNPALLRAVRGKGRIFPRRV